MTYGARGGLSGLGAISQDNMKGAGGPLHEVVEIGGKSGRIGQSKIPGYNPPPPKNPIPPSSNTATLYMAAFTPPAPSGRGKGTTLEDRRKAGYTPPPVVVAPIAPPKLKEPPRSLPPTIVSGGGSSVSLPPRVVVPDLEPVEIPEIPEIAVDPGPSAAPPSSKRNLLILAGGLGLAAYLLLRDDKKD